MTNYNFKAREVRADFVEWIREMKNHGLKGVVLGISGGKDSTVVAALCAEALGPENVLGVLMPNGDQKDIDDSYRVVNTLGIPYMVVNIADAMKGLVNRIDYGFRSIHNCDKEIELSMPAYVNIGPRIRMTTLYSIAQSMGGGYRVCGTGNLSERTLGYFTKWGDGASDFNPLGNLTSLEVVAIGDTYENIPSDLIHKTPEDGLSGMSDEEKLGIKYIDVHEYIRNPEMNVESPEYKKILEKEAFSMHKKNEIPIFKPNVKHLYD